MTGFDKIKVKTPYAIKTIEEIGIEHKINDHGKAYLKGIADDSVNIKNVINASSKDEIHIYETDEKEETIFKGTVSNIKTTNVNGIYYIEIEGISGSFQLDKKKKCRSFQDINMEYPELIREVLKEYRYGDFISSAGDGIKISSPVIQYEETDWEFIKRLAGKLNTVIACDITENKPRLYFGIHRGKSYTIEDDIPYRAIEDITEYRKAKEYEEDAVESDFYKYEVESGEKYSIGDEITFRNKKMYVSSVTGRMSKGLFVYTYQLSRLKGIRQDAVYNTALKGVSLEGKVLDIKGEDVKLKLNIDKEQEESKAYWFPFTSETNNVMYCMPQKGTNVSLYFPDTSGKQAQVIRCIRRNGDSCAKTSDPCKRYWGTESGSELELLPSAINIVSGAKQPLKICIDDNTGINIISNKKLIMNALEEISLYTPKAIRINSQGQLVVKKNSTLSGFAIDNEFHFLSNNVKTNGRERVKYPNFDDEPKKGQPPKKKPFDWIKLLKNVAGSLLAVAAVTTAEVINGNWKAAAGAAIAGVSAVASMAISDISRGEVSDYNDYINRTLKEAMAGAVIGATFGPQKVFNTIVLKDIQNLIYCKNDPLRILKTNPALSKIVSIIGFTYDPEQHIFTSNLNPWQKNYGYFDLYDKAATSKIASDFDCNLDYCPIRFKYNKKYWNIELWKGQYCLSTGAEIGIYTGQNGLSPIISSLPGGQQSSYDDTACADKQDFLQMSFTLYRNGIPIFSRDSDDANTSQIEKHWWLTGFQPFIYSNPSDLIMDINITLKDIEMCRAFVGALKTPPCFLISVNESTVHFIYKTK